MMEQTLNIRQFGSLIRKRILFILSLGVICAGISWIFAAYYIQPSYEASRQIVVNNTSPNADVMTNFQYANTYSDIIYSEVVLDKVINDLRLNKTYHDFSKQIQVTSKQDSQVITITVKDADYKQAVNMANTIANVFKQQVLEIMKVDNVQLFPPTKANPVPNSIQPNPVLLAVVGLIAGLIIGLTISFLLEVFNNTITSESEIEELFNIPVIGSVSKVQPRDLNIKSTENIRISQTERVGGGQVER